MSILIKRVISTSNHVFRRKIWDKFGKLQIVSEKLQIISGKFQNNVINEVKQISLSHVIMIQIIYILLQFSKRLLLKKRSTFFKVSTVSILFAPTQTNILEFGPVSSFDEWFLVGLINFFNFTNFMNSSNQ